MLFNLGQKSQPPATNCGCVLELLLLRKTEGELLMVSVLKWTGMIVYCLTVLIGGRRLVARKDQFL